MVVFLALAILAGQAGTPPTTGAAAAPDSRFRRLDRDGNGYITANEAPRVSLTRGPGEAPATGAAAWIAAYDRDGDGRVSPQEYAAGPRATTTRTDLVTGEGGR